MSKTPQFDGAIAAAIQGPDWTQHPGRPREKLRQQCLAVFGRALPALELAVAQIADKLTVAIDEDTGDEDGPSATTVAKLSGQLLRCMDLLGKYSGLLSIDVTSGDLPLSAQYDYSKLDAGEAAELLRLLRKALREPDAQAVEVTASAIDAEIVE